MSIKSFSLKCINWLITQRASHPKLKQKQKKGISSTYLRSHLARCHGHNGQLSHHQWLENSPNLDLRPLYFRSSTACPDPQDPAGAERHERGLGMCRQRQNPSAIHGRHKWLLHARVQHRRQHPLWSKWVFRSRPTPYYPLPYLPSYRNSLSNAYACWLTPATV